MKAIGCLVRCFFVALLLLAGFIALGVLVSQLPTPQVSSSNTTPPVSNSKTETIIRTESGTEFKLLMAKLDPKGNDHYMEIFVADRKPTISDLREFAHDRRNNMRGKNEFYDAVVFDNEQNARFPTNPFTAFYGLDPIQSHIIGHYSTTNFNDYSELTTIYGKAIPIK